MSTVCQCVQSPFTAAHLCALAATPPGARPPAAVAALAAELRRAPLAGAVGAAALAALARTASAQLHAPGSVIMRQGDRGACMHVVLEGSVNVHALAPEAAAVRAALAATAAEAPPTLLDTSAEVRPPAKQKS